MMGRGRGQGQLQEQEESLLLSAEERFGQFANAAQDWVAELSDSLRRLRVGAGVVALAQLLALALAVGMHPHAGDDSDDNGAPDHYLISKSREDVFGLLAGSSAAGLGAALVPRAYTVTALLWLQACVAVALVAKAIAWDWTEPAGSAYHRGTSILLGLGLACGAALVGMVSSISSQTLERHSCETFLRTRGREGELPGSITQGLGKLAPRLTRLQLLGVMKPYFYPKGLRNKLRCFVTYFFLFTAKVCNLVAPLFIGRAVRNLGVITSNSSSSEGDMSVHDDVYPNVIAFALLVLCSKLCTELQNVTYLGVKQNAFVEIAERAFWHVHTLSLEWHLKKKLGITLRSLDRGIAAADTVVSYLFLYLVPSFFELIATVAVFYRHFRIPSLSALVFVCFAAYVAITIKLTLWRKKFRESTNKHDNDFHEKATDSLQNFETVKYFTAERFETDRYVVSVRKYQTYSVSMQGSLSILNASQQLVLQACAGCALCIAAYHVSRGDLDIGAFVSVQVYVASLFAPLSFLGTIYNAIIQAFTDMANLSGLLAEHPDVTDDAQAQDLVPYVQNKPPSVSFHNVYFRYPTQAEGAGLRGVSFSVQPGQELAIVGPTGSGKSSLFRLLFRFYDVNAGEIRIAGLNIRRVTLQSLRQTIGVVPQDTVLFNDSILFNVRYGKPDATMEEVEEACRKAQILDRIRSFPQQFNTHVGGSGNKLSGGERQRVAIARCILKDAPILVLDEWSSALDSETEKEIHTAITALSKARTTLVIAHRLSTVKRSNQIIVLEHGEIRESGTHEDLLSRKGRYADMWAKQMFEEEQQQNQNQNQEGSTSATTAAAVTPGIASTSSSSSMT